MNLSNCFFKDYGKKRKNGNRTKTIEIVVISTRYEGNYS